MTSLGYGFSLGLRQQAGGAAAPPPAAPAVQQRVTVAGDSWTSGNEARQSRNGAATPVDGDMWHVQLASLMGVPYYANPWQAQGGGQPSSGSVATGVINAGYGGQTSPTIYNNINAIITGDVGRAQDTWTWWGGRNEVTSPGGEGFEAITIAQAGNFLARIPHERKFLLAPYGGNGVSGSITSQANWVRMSRIKWDYRRTKRKYVFEGRKWWRALSPYGSDGTAANDLLVAGDAWPQNLFASAAADQAHPNYLSSPLISAGLQGAVEAAQNKRVWMLDQTIPDVRYDLPAGATLEVYFKGYVTACSIAADDATYPGLFTIAMKPGSNDTALLTRTSTSPGNIAGILKLMVKADGYDTAGAAKTHTGEVRILPSAVGAASTLPVGATLQRDANATVTSRRFPVMAASAGAFANGPRVSFIWNGRFGEDGTAMVLASIATLRFNVQRNASNKLIVTAQDTAGTTVLSLTSTVNFTQALGNVWLFVSLDISATPTASVWYLAGGTEASLGTPATLAAGNGSIALGTQVNIFANTYTAQTNFKGSQRVWLMDDRLFEFSVAGNRRLFANIDGSPVDYAANNYAAIGGQPKYDLRGAPGDFVTGKHFGSAADLAFNDNWGSRMASSSDPAAW